MPKSQYCIYGDYCIIPQTNDTYNTAASPNVDDIHVEIPI